MKTKTIAYFLYCLSFCAVCAVPGVLLLRPSSESVSSVENRKLAEFPKFHDENGAWNKEWSTQVQEYVSDHFGFREQLITADSRMRSGLLKTSTVEDVIIGQDGWLYYTPTSDDCIGKATVSELGIQNIVKNLEMLQAYAASQGTTLVTAVIPNKNTIYPEYMPYYYRVSGADGNLEHLQAAVSGRNINWCDMTAALTEQASTEQIYHKTDTHWNNTGALAGYRAIMECTGQPFEAFAEASYTTELDWTGDLAKMLYLDSAKMDAQNHYDIPQTFKYQGHYQGTDDLAINTLNPAGTGSLLMFRDSFGAAVIPYFSQQYRTVRYSRARPNPANLLEGGQYTTAVLEIVERNIAWLQKEAPIHPALAAEEVPVTEGTAHPAKVHILQNGELIQFFGTLDLPAGLTEAPEYSFTLHRSDGSSSYLAYHCCESDKLKLDAIGDNGFSLYISAEECQWDSLTLTAKTQQGDILYTFTEIVTEDSE